MSFFSGRHNKFSHARTYQTLPIVMVRIFKNNAAFVSFVYFTMPNFFNGVLSNSIRPSVAFNRQIVGDDIFTLNGIYWGKCLTMTVTDRGWVSDLL